MLYPTNFSVPRTSRIVTEVFGGYNANTVIGDNEFSYINNMSTDSYPALATRKHHALYKNFKHQILGAISTNDKLTYVYLDNAKRLHIVIDEDEESGDYTIDYTPLKDSEYTGRSIVVMGAYYVILPDKMYFNSVDPNDKGKIEIKNTVNGDIKIQLTNEEGKPYSAEYRGEEEPTKDPNYKDLVFYDGDIWENTNDNRLYEYSFNKNSWTLVEHKYITIEAPKLTEGLETGDLIDISGLVNADEPYANINLEGVNGSRKIVKIDGDSLTVEYSIEVSFLIEVRASITVARTMPNMDIIFEHENRLWGCRYGDSINGEFVNEIYASALGDFKRWYVFDGVSTDSFTASVGTPGKFTAGISYLGRPYFFKEDSILTVYGKYPAQYQLDVTNGRGVLEGADKSLALVNELLYYRSRHDICAFDGTLPVSVSYALGELPLPDTRFDNPAYGTACAFRDNYIIALSYRKKNETPINGMLIYDTRTKIWQITDDEMVSIGNLILIEGQQDVYRLYPGNDFVHTLYDTPYNNENIAPDYEKKFSWAIETGDIFLSTPDNKYITRITIRLRAENDVHVKVKYARGSYDDELTHTSTLACKKTLHSFSLPIKSIRTDSFRIRIEGKGQACIYSIAKTVEEGSELNNYKSEVVLNDTI